jgi:peptidoglycan hydrolase-like protein with peptidoglycan-binding domain
MRFVIGALLAVVLAASVGAQPKKPAPAAASDPVAASYAAMSEADRKAIQTDLIWAGHYLGAVDGEFGPRAIAAVKAFQKSNRSKQTGVLNPQERSKLALAARRKREAVGWRIIDDKPSLTRIGIPTKIAPQHNAIANGSRWTSGSSDAQIETFRIAAPGTTLAAVYEAQRTTPERTLSYSIIRSDFFVVSGTQGDRKLYIRGQTNGVEVRGFSIQYDAKLAPTLDPVTIAMASASQAFAGTPTVSIPPPRRKVEYGTAVLIDPSGYAITTRDLIEGCESFTLAGYGPAELVAEDKGAGVAALRIYGARGLKTLALADNVGPGAVTLVGVLDPARQRGAGEVSAITAKSVQVTGGNGFIIEPTPGLGFAGAAVLDTSGKLAGIADVRTQTVAGPAGAAQSQAMLIGGDAIKKFLTAGKIADSGSGVGVDAAKAATVRLICVRK